MRHGTILALTAGLCAGLTAVAAAGSGVSAGAGRELRAVDTRGDGVVGMYHFKAWREMSVDGGWVAVKGEAGAGLDGALVKAGLKPSEARELGVRGWRLVAVPAGVAVEAAVRSLAGSEAVEFASPVLVGEGGLPVWVTPGVMVGFVDGVSQEERDALTLLAGAEASAGPRWENFPQMDLVGVDAKDGYAVLEAANALAAMPEVAFAEADLMITGRHDFIPNDTFFGDLWGIHNVGQSGGTADMDMDGPEAWDVTLGSGNIIALVMDVGVQMDHPDLNLAFGGDFTGQGTGGNPGNSCDNHGTAVASCISGIINNGRGVAGLAPGCRVASARIGSSNPACDGTWTGNLSWSADALNWGMANGVRVSNNSNSYGGTSAAVEAAYAVTRNAGMVHFASAGNSGAGSIAYPSSIAGVNSVAALDRNGNRTSFSQFGPGLDFSAPGQTIYCADRTGGNGYVAGDYVILDGTSFASPYSAGVACLVLSKNPTMSAAQVENIMAVSAVDRGASGYDTGYGWGFVNALSSLNNTPGYNNDCGRALQVFGGGVYSGTLAGASNDGTASCGSSGSSPDVWYSFVAPGGPVGGTLYVSTCGTHDAGGVDTGIDTVLSLHGSCGAGSFACNDDNTGQCGGSDSGTRRDSYVQAGLSPGQVVLIRVANFASGGTGPFVLNVTYAVANDSCGSAIDVSGGGSFTGTLNNASADGFGACGASDGNPDVWYSYTQGACPGRATFTTCGTNGSYGVDTVLSVFDGCGGTVLGCNDDSSACGVFSLDSLVGVDLAAGQTVKVRVSKFGGRIVGDFVLNVSNGVGSNDTCANAITITDGAYTVCNSLATTDGPAEPGCSFCCGDPQVNNDMWYRYVAPGSGTATVDTCASPSPFDTKLAVYLGGCPTQPGTAITCSDDGCNGTLSSLQFSAVAGQSYLIRFGGFAGNRGSALLNVHTLLVCPADFNGDGFLDFFDYDDYVSCFETAVCPPGKTADFNGDGFADFFDYDDFVLAFEVGC